MFLVVWPALLSSRGGPAYGRLFEQCVCEGDSFWVKSHCVAVTTMECWGKRVPRLCMRSTWLLLILSPPLVTFSSRVDWEYAAGLSEGLEGHTDRWIE